MNVFDIKNTAIILSATVGVFSTIMTINMKIDILVRFYG